MESILVYTKIAVKFKIQYTVMRNATLQPVFVSMLVIHVFSIVRSATVKS
jgi:hypothetical protein